MLLKTFTDKNLAQNAYVVGCQKTNEAIIIDPPRHVEPIIEAMAEEGMNIIAAVDTHIHADYVSGARQFGVEYGATVYLSDEGNEDWKYEYTADINAKLIKEGSIFSIGHLDFEVLHTPGHTPESISLLLTDRGGGATEPMGIFTGDFVFVGDVGRPDLLEEVAGMTGTAVSGAKQMFQSVQRFKQLPDYLIVWPGHGAGSACGKALGAVPTTTVGYEKQFNWAMQINDEATFVETLLEDQPEAPVYFAKMKQLNKLGPAVLTNKTIPFITDQKEAEKWLAKENTLIIDTRPIALAKESIVANSMNIPFTGSFTNWVGWLVDEEEQLMLIVHQANQTAITKALQSIGFDHIIAFIDETLISTCSTTAYETVTYDELLANIDKPDTLIIDVRNEMEWNTNHFQSATHHFLGTFRKADIPADKKILLHCVSGARSSIAASILTARGYKHVANVTGDLQAALKKQPTKMEEA